MQLTASKCAGSRHTETEYMLCCYRNAQTHVRATVEIQGGDNSAECQTLTASMLYRSLPYRSVGEQSNVNDSTLLKYQTQLSFLNTS